MNQNIFLLLFWLSFPLNFHQHDHDPMTFTFLKLGAQVKVNPNTRFNFDLKNISRTLSF